MKPLEYGQFLEAQGRFQEAVKAYDQAIAASREDAQAHGIAWMNRGNALQKIGAESLSAAVESYDHAIALFSSLPLETEPGHRNQLGAALLNRGHALLSAGQGASAVDSFNEAIAQLEQLPLDANPYFRLNLAGARTNLAHVMLSADPARSRAEAQAALAVVASVDRTHPAFAEMSLRARRALVMALGPADDRERVSEATDTIDEGLQLARDWEDRGVNGLRPLAARLFRLGAQLYRVNQPHFLAEYLLENLSFAGFAQDAEFCAAADEAIGLALATLQQPSVLKVDDAASARFVETARSLREAQQQVSALCAQFPARSA